MNHIHRICRFLASLTRPAGILVARRAAVPAATATTRAEPPRWTTLTPVPAPNRAIATSEPRAGVRPQPPRESCAREPCPPGCRTPSRSASTAGRTRPGSGSAAPAARRYAGPGAYPAARDWTGTAAT